MAWLADFAFLTGHWRDCIDINDSAASIIFIWWCFYLLMAMIRFWEGIFFFRSLLPVAKETLYLPSFLDYWLWACIIDRCIWYCLRLWAIFDDDIGSCQWVLGLFDLIKIAARVLDTRSRHVMILIFSFFIFGWFDELNMIATPTRRSDTSLHFLSFMLLS